MNSSNKAAPKLYNDPIIISMYNGDKRAQLAFSAACSFVDQNFPGFGRPYAPHILTFESIHALFQQLKRDLSAVFTSSLEDNDIIIDIYIPDAKTANHNGNILP